MSESTRLSITTRSFLRQVWALTKPYWFSEERWAARGLLAAVVTLNLGLVFITVLINQWNNDFFNALQNKDSGAFSHQLSMWLILAPISLTNLFVRNPIRLRNWVVLRLGGRGLSNRPQPWGREAGGDPAPFLAAAVGHPGGKDRPLEFGRDPPLPRCER
jgi:putative ATP-binding cassette transporter